MTASCRGFSGREKSFALSLYVARLLYTANTGGGGGGGGRGGRGGEGRGGGRGGEEKEENEYV